MNLSEKMARWNSGYATMRPPQPATATAAAQATTTAVKPHSTVQPTTAQPTAQLTTSTTAQPTTAQPGAQAITALRPATIQPTAQPTTTAQPAIGQPTAQLAAAAAVPLATATFTSAQPPASISAQPTANINAQPTTTTMAQPITTTGQAITSALPAHTTTAQPAPTTAQPTIAQPTTAQPTTAQPIFSAPTPIPADVSVPAPRSATTTPAHPGAKPASATSTPWDSQTWDALDALERRHIAGQAALPQAALPQGPLPQGPLPQAALPQAALLQAALPQPALPQGAVVPLPYDGGVPWPQAAVVAWPQLPAHALQPAEQLQQLPQPTGQPHQPQEGGQSSLPHLTGHLPEPLPPGQLPQPPPIGRPHQQPTRSQAVPPLPGPLAAEPLPPSHPMPPSPHHHHHHQPPLSPAHPIYSLDCPSPPVPSPIQPAQPTEPLRAPDTCPTSVSCVPETVLPSGRSTPMSVGLLQAMMAGQGLGQGDSDHHAATSMGLLTAMQAGQGSGHADPSHHAGMAGHGPAAGAGGPQGAGDNGATLANGLCMAHGQPAEQQQQQQQGHGQQQHGQQQQQQQWQQWQGWQQQLQAQGQHWQQPQGQQQWQLQPQPPVQPPPQLLPAPHQPPEPTLQPPIPATLPHAASISFAHAAGGSTTTTPLLAKQLTFEPLAEPLTHVVVPWSYDSPCSQEPTPEPMHHAAHPAQNQCQQQPVAGGAIQHPAHPQHLQQQPVAAGVIHHAAQPVQQPVAAGTIYHAAHPDHDPQPHDTDVVMAGPSFDEPRLGQNMGPSGAAAVAVPGAPELGTDVAMQAAYAQPAGGDHSAADRQADAATAAASAAQHQHHQQHQLDQQPAGVVQCARTGASHGRQAHASHGTPGAESDWMEQELAREERMMMQQGGGDGDDADGGDGDHHPAFNQQTRPGQNLPACQQAQAGQDLPPSWASPAQRLSPGQTIPDEPTPPGWASPAQHIPVGQTGQAQHTLPGLCSPAQQTVQGFTSTGQRMHPGQSTPGQGRQTTPGQDTRPNQLGPDQDPVPPGNAQDDKICDDPNESEDKSEDGSESEDMMPDVRDIPEGLSQPATEARLAMLRQLQPQSPVASPAPHQLLSARGGASVVATPISPAGPTQLSYDLEDYLPREMAEVYRSACGVNAQLYQWQAECLHLPGVVRGRNLVFSAPTSAGKTIVYEVLALRRLITTGRPFMLVLPTVALCEQKAKALEKLLAPLNKKVGRFYGGQKSGHHLDKDTGANVCTIEMANKIINRMLEEDSLSQLGTLVVDELHMVGDNDRGYLLELLLTKLSYATQTLTAEHEGQAGSHASAVTQEGVQVIGMSATMPNVAQVASWLGAELYETKFRPVPLKEYIKSGDKLRARGDNGMEVVRTLMPPSTAWDPKRDPDHIALLARETTMDGHSCLIFCGTKDSCKGVAKLIADMLGTIPERLSPAKAGRPGDTLAEAGASTGARAAVSTGMITPPPTGKAGGPPFTGGPGSTTGALDTTPQPAEAQSRRQALVEELKKLNGNADLVSVVERGVAFHHGGLDMEERVLVERAYRQGVVLVLCCTTTMAVGVNLPARRVIFRHTWLGLASKSLTVSEYRQMAGRAGRAGIDEAGESIIIVPPKDNETRLTRLMTDDAAPIVSCLVEGKRGMKRAMLEVVVCGAVKTGQDVSRFIRCTLMCATQDKEQVKTVTIAALHWLSKEGFIMCEEGMWGPRPLGKATVEAVMDPDDALMVKNDLELARHSFVMSTDLHLTYLVTPARGELFNINWNRYCEIAERLHGPDRLVMDRVGLRLPLLIKYKQNGGAAMDAERDKKDEFRVARKFFAALALLDIINEVPLTDVAERYGQFSLQPLKDLQDRAGKTAGMVAAFCHQMGWSDLEMLVVKFSGRVRTGAQADLVALTEIPGIGVYRARALYKAGMRSPEALATADVARITEILVAASSGKGNRKDEQVRAIERRAAKLIYQGARSLVQAKIADLRAQADAALAAYKDSQTSSSMAPGSATQPSASQGRRPGGIAATTPPTTHRTPTRTTLTLQAITPVAFALLPLAARADDAAAAPTLGPQPQAAQVVAAAVGPRTCASTEPAAAPLALPAPMSNPNLNPLALPAPMSWQGQPAIPPPPSLAQWQANPAQPPPQPPELLQVAAATAPTSNRSEPTAMDVDNNQHQPTCANGCASALGTTNPLKRPADPDAPGRPADPHAPGRPADPTAPAGPAEPKDSGPEVKRQCKRPPDVPLGAMVPPAPPLVANGPQLVDTPEQLSAVHASIRQQPDGRRRVAFVLCFSPQGAGGTVVVEPLNGLKVPSLAAARKSSNSSKPGSKAGSREATPEPEAPTKPVPAAEEADTKSVETDKKPSETEKKPPTAMHDLGDLVGASISTADGGCYYVKLKSSHAQPGVGELQSATMLAMLMQLFWDKTITKVTCCLKQQLKALAAASGRWTDLPAVPGFKDLPARDSIWTLGAPLIDVVVAYWIRDPRQEHVCEVLGGRTQSWPVRLQEWVEKISGSSAAKDALSGLSSASTLPNPPTSFSLVPGGGIPPASGGAAACTSEGGGGGDGAANDACSTLQAAATARGSGGGCGSGPGAAARASSSGGGSAAAAVAVPGSSRWCGIPQLESMRQASLCRKLWESVELQLTAEGLITPLLEIEMPLVRVLAAMEMTGMGVDRQKLTAQRPKLLERCEQLTTHAHQAVGGIKFNIHSPRVISDLLFRTTTDPTTHKQVGLGLPVPPGAQGARGGISTKKEFLTEVAHLHPVVPILLTHRTVSKQLSCLNSMIAMCDTHTAKATTTGPSNATKPPLSDVLATIKGGISAKLLASAAALALPRVCRIHGTYLHTASATGRLSMDEPNLQTVPNPKQLDIDSSQLLAEGGGPGLTTFQVNMRAAFVAPPAHVLISADYAQVELRMMAHLSGDPGLVTMLSQAQHDPFRAMAAAWKRIAPDTVTKAERDGVKKLCYGLLYGMGSNALSKELGVTMQEAEEKDREFKASMPDLMKWMERVVKGAKERGYVKTLAGRRRWLRDDQHVKNSGHLARCAVNTVCQGSAADLAKCAMLKIHAQLQQPHLKGAARLVHMVHDEFVLEVQSTRMAEVALLVEDSMMHAWEASTHAPLSVPFPVEISVGQSWGDMQPVDREQLEQWKMQQQQVVVGGASAGVQIKAVKARAVRQKRG